MSMKETKPIMLATIAVFLVGLCSELAVTANAAVIQFNEFQITSNTASQENPDIDGIRIVYQDNRNGNWDIYMYTLQGAFEPESRITDNPAYQMVPAIYGDKIVYQDNRNGNWDIYMYDLTTQTETQITDNPSSQEHPAIDGNRIVWQDNRNGDWDIYLYDLSTQTEQRVTTSGANTGPAISGDLIAYTKNYEVYFFDLSRGAEVRVSPNFYDRHASAPAISGSRIVFCAQHYNTYGHELWNDVHMKDVATGAWWGPPAYVGDQTHPDISELYSGIYYIVYQVLVDKTWLTSGNWNIYLSNTGTGADYRVANSGRNQLNPKVSGGYIVYMDDRNGNWDIYMTMVSYMPGGGGPPTPVAAIQQIQGIQNLVADPAEIPTSDMVGANGRVKENRRDALVNKLDAVIASIQAAADAADPASRAADYQSAIEQLDSVLAKMDGCARSGLPDTKGSRYTPDWIITCASQELIDPPIRDSIVMLQTLLQQN